MKITVIYATQRKSKSSTWQIAQQFIGRLSEGEPVKEFSLPKDMPHFCKGCWNCFTDYETCPDYGSLKPVLEAMLEADLLVFTAPVYVYHVPGQLKAFLDHFGYQWMAHRPREEMFSKRALLISTAAGAGTKSTLQDLAHSLIYWGVARLYPFGCNVRGADWDTVGEEIKQKLQKKIEKLAAKIEKTKKGVTPSVKVKALFYLMRFMHKKFHFNPVDVNYWEEKGWLGKKRPW